MNQTILIDCEDNAKAVSVSCLYKIGNSFFAQYETRFVAHGSAMMANNDAFSVGKRAVLI